MEDDISWTTTFPDIWMTTLSHFVSISFKVHFLTDFYIVHLAFTDMTYNKFPDIKPILDH